MYLDIKTNKEDTRPMYIRLCDAIKNSIGDGEIGGGEKLPSIRKLASELEISRTTVELAYAQLSVEGFIESRPQSGYYACDPHRDTGDKDIKEKINQENEKIYKYSFLSGSIDKKAIDTDRWRKKVRNVLTSQESIASYGSPQGERELREQLCKYAGKVRSVKTTPGNIIIGAGIQPLLSILCALTQELNEVTMLTPFNKAERIFSDHKLNIRKDDTLCNNAQLLFVDPSGWNSGTPLSISGRVRLLDHVEKYGGYIIEDDYNGELRTSSRPMPSMQRNDPDRVVYLGSFSKLLMPSVRLSYMVLPDKLAMKYRERRNDYNQTASKVEQLALAEYMKSGELEKQLRRLRKLYGEKSRLLKFSLEQLFPESEISINEIALYAILTVPDSVSAEKIKTNAEKVGIGLDVKNINGRAGIVLSYSGIAKEDIPLAVEELSTLIK